MSSPPSTLIDDASDATEQPTLPSINLAKSPEEIIELINNSRHAKLSMPHLAALADKKQSMSLLASLWADKMYYTISALIVQASEDTGYPDTYFLNELGQERYRQKQKSRKPNPFNGYVREKLEELNEDREPGDRVRLPQVVAQFREDYRGLESEVKERYAGRQEDFRKGRDEKLMHRTGQALANDVTKTQNTVTEILQSLYQRTGQASLFISVRTSASSHAKPILFETMGFENFFLNRFKLTRQMILDTSRDYAKTQVEEINSGVRRAIQDGEKPLARMNQAEERQFLVKLIRHSLRKAGGDENLEMKYVDFEEKLTCTKRIILIGWPSNISLSCPSSLLRHEVKALIDLMLSKPPTLRFKKLSRAQYIKYVDSNGEDWGGDEDDLGGEDSEDEDDSVRLGKKRKGKAGSMSKQKKSGRMSGSKSLPREEVNNLSPSNQRPALQNTTNQPNIDVSPDLTSGSLINHGLATVAAASPLPNSFPFTNLDQLAVPSLMSHQCDDSMFSGVFKPSSTGEFIFTDEYMASVVQPTLPPTYDFNLLNFPTS